MVFFLVNFALLKCSQPRLVFDFNIKNEMRLGMVPCQGGMDNDRKDHVRTVQAA